MQNFPMLSRQHDCPSNKYSWLHWVHFPVITTHTVSATYYSSIIPFALMTEFVSIIILTCSDCRTISAHTEPQPEQFVGRSGVKFATFSVTLNRILVGRLSTSDSEGVKMKGIFELETQLHHSFFGFRLLLWCSRCRNSDMASGMSASGIEDAISSTNLTWSQRCFLCLQVVHRIFWESETLTTTPYPESVRMHTTCGWQNEATACMINDDNWVHKAKQKSLLIPLDHGRFLCCHTSDL